MPSLITVAGLLGGSALPAIMMMMTDATQVQTGSGPTRVTFGTADSAAAIATSITATSDNAAGDAGARQDNAAAGADGAGAGAGGGGMMGVGDAAGMEGMAGMGGMGGGMGGMLGAGVQRVRSPLPSVPRPTSGIAMNVLDALGNEVDFSVTGTLAELPGLLGTAAKIPVIVDDRGVEFAKLRSENIEITFDESEQGVPLEVALRRKLSPLGLKADVRNEGLVITADPLLLVHRGIGTSRWINIDRDAAEKIAAALEKQTTVEFVDTPLSEAIDEISQQHDLPILIDRIALEDIGLSADQPVTLSLSNLKLRSVLSLMLAELDLTYSIHHESMVITTTEAAEQRLLNRIYWLEGTGYARGDYQSIIDLIQTSIVPDTWEALGGPSTMAPTGAVRPALVVSATYRIHEDIEQLIQTLRETYFGAEPVMPGDAGQRDGTGAIGGGMGGGGGFF